MNNYKEYKYGTNESLFILMENSNNDILETQKEITEMGYIIIEIGCLSISAGHLTAIKAKKVQGLKEALL